MGGWHCCKAKMPTRLLRPSSPPCKPTACIPSTYDNGLEFAGHQPVSEALGAAGYFCKPYHSWEKGGVENFNGLVRQYFPKGTNFFDVGEPRLAHIEAQLNQRPRKTLHFLSPDNLKRHIAA